MVGAQELVLFTRENGRQALCGRTCNVSFAAEESADFTETRGSPTAVQFIRVVATVVDAVAPLRHLQTHAIILAAESSGRRALELP